MSRTAKDRGGKNYVRDLWSRRPCSQHSNTKYWRALTRKKERVEERRKLNKHIIFA